MPNGTYGGVRGEVGNGLTYSILDRSYERSSNAVSFDGKICVTVSSVPQG